MPRKLTPTFYAGDTVEATADVFGETLKGSRGTVIQPSAAYMHILPGDDRDVDGSVWVEWHSATPYRSVCPPEHLRVIPEG